MEYPMQIVTKSWCSPSGEFYCTWDELWKSSHCIGIVRDGVFYPSQLNSVCVCVCLSQRFESRDAV